VQCYELSLPAGGPGLALHGGAGDRVAELSLEGQAGYGRGLGAAYAAGWNVLSNGGTALDAVCAAVEVLENDPLFNAGRGAALTAAGRAELDASVMTGDGQAGAVAASKHAKNPVRLARRVMEDTPHVLLVNPSEKLVREFGLDTADQDYFVTPARVRQLERVLASRAAAPRHGTVGAVARDGYGHLAAATSTGGMVGQADGRVGDTPIVGAGVYARNQVAAVSCTGHGEAFIRGVVAYDIAARVRYTRARLLDAVRATVEGELSSCGATGGLIAVGGDGAVVVAHNSPAMFSAHGWGAQPEIHT